MNPGQSRTSKGHDRIATGHFGGSSPSRPSGATWTYNGLPSGVLRMPGGAGEVFKEAGEFIE